MVPPSVPEPIGQGPTIIARNNVQLALDFNHDKSSVSSPDHDTSLPLLIIDIGGEEERDFP